MGTGWRTGYGAGEQRPQHQRELASLELHARAHDAKSFARDACRGGAETAVTSRHAIPYFSEQLAHVVLLTSQGFFADLIQPAIIIQ